MAIFGSGIQKKEQRSTISDSESATLMTKCMEIHGDIKGCGSIHIDGIVHGDVEVEKSVVVGKISHAVKAKELVSDGKIDALLDVEEKVHITQNGTVITNKLESRHIVVNGLIEGKMTVKKIKVAEGGLMLGTMLTYHKDENVKKVSKIMNKDNNMKEGTEIEDHAKNEEKTSI